MKRILILMMAAMPLVYSCSKDHDDSEPTTPEVPENVKKLQKDLVGKWEFNDITLKARSANGRVSTHHSSMSLTGRKKGHNGSKELGTLTPEIMIGYIEFLTDSTYLIYDSEQNFYQGKFNAVTGDSISLGKFGAIGGIKFANNQLNFKLYYNGSNTIIITANKAAAVATDSRTTSISRPWYLTTQDSGHIIIGQYDSYYDDSTDSYKEFIVDSLGLIITSSGTYIVQQFEKGKLRSADVANWKWHSTKADRFVYYWYGDEPDEDNDYITITEVTSSVLKVSEIDDLNGDGIDDVVKYVFKPAH